MFHLEGFPSSELSCSGFQSTYVGQAQPWHLSDLRLPPGQPLSHMLCAYPSLPLTPHSGASLAPLSFSSLKAENLFFIYVNWHPWLHSKVRLGILRRDVHSLVLVTPHKVDEPRAMSGPEVSESSPFLHHSPIIRLHVPMALQTGFEGFWELLCPSGEILLSIFNFDILGSHKI